MAEARLVEAGKESDYAPKLRTNGTGLPGFACGWFKLANGSKALAFLTQPDQVVYLPLLDGDFVIMLSAEDGAGLLEELKNYHRKNLKFRG